MAVLRSHTPMALFATVLMTLLTLAPAATAQQSAAARLFDTLRMADIIEVMHKEGLTYGHDLGEEWIPERTGPGWDAEVARVYDQDQMLETMKSVFAKTLGETDTTALEAFFVSDTGQTILTLESSARAAFLDTTLEEAAKERLAVLEKDGDGRLKQVKDFVEANDYVERNVVGAMNSNLAFYEGLFSVGGRLGNRMPDELLEDVWAQEPQIRESTTEWLLAYLTMSYQPLTDAQLEAYRDLLLTDEGKAMTYAMFEGFDVMYVDISRNLGKVLGQYVNQVDL